MHRRIPIPVCRERAVETEVIVVIVYLSNIPKLTAGGRERFQGMEILSLVLQQCSRNRHNLVRGYGIVVKQLLMNEKTTQATVTVQKRMKKYESE